MSHPHTLTCPSCGAPLVEGDQVQAQCSYCGNYISVHEELRAPRTSSPAAPPSASPTTSPSVIARATLGPADIARIQQLLRDRRKIEAIRYYRERLAPTPGLKEASDAVDAMERQMGLVPAKPADSYALPAFLALVVVGACLCLCVSIASQGQTRNKDAGPASAQTTPIHIAVQPTAIEVQPTPVVIFGGDGTGPGQFQNAHYIAIDGHDEVYVSDYGSMRVQRFDENGKYLSEWSIAVKGKFPTRAGAEALAADRAGNVYVAWTGLILKYEGATGRLLDTFVGEKIDDTTILTEDFKSIAISPDGGLWAISNMNSRDDLVHLDAHGKVINRIKKVRSNIEADIFASEGQRDAALLVSPENLRIATDKLGNLYMVNRGAHDPAVYKFTSEGKYFARVGSQGNQPGQFSSLFYPDIAVDSRGRLYVDDDDRIGIHIFDENGHYLDRIVTKDYFGSWGIALNSKNELYMVNAENMIYKFPPFPD